MNFSIGKSRKSTTYAVQNFASSRRNVGSQLERFVENVVTHFGQVAAVEGRQSVQHFVQNGTQTPPVDRPIVLFLAQHFRCQILGRTAKGSRRVSLPKSVLAQTKVGQDDVSIAIQQNVFRFQVPVDDALRVKIAEGTTDFGGIETSAGFGKATLFLQVKEQLEEEGGEESTEVNLFP